MREREGRGRGTVDRLREWTSLPFVSGRLGNLEVGMWMGDCRLDG